MAGLSLKSIPNRNESPVFSRSEWASAKTLTPSRAASAATVLSLLWKVRAAFNPLTLSDISSAKTTTRCSTENYNKLLVWTRQGATARGPSLYLIDFRSRLCSRIRTDFFRSKNLKNWNTDAAQIRFCNGQTSKLYPKEQMTTYGTQAPSNQMMNSYKTRPYWCSLLKTSVKRGKMN